MAKFIPDDEEEQDGAESAPEDQDEEQDAEANLPEGGEAPTSFLDAIPGVKVAALGAGAPGIGISQDSQLDALQAGGAPPVGALQSSKTLESPEGSKILDYKKFLLTPEDLKAVANAKSNAAIGTALADSLGNSQSAGNFWLKALNPKTNIGPALAAMTQAAEAPVQAKQMMQAQAMRQPEMELASQLSNPKSMASQLVASNAIAALSQLKAKTPEQAQSYQALKLKLASGTMPGSQIKSLIDSDPLLKESFTASIMGQKLDQMMARIDSSNQNNAQTKVDKDPTLNTYIPRLDGASKILGLIQAGERGEFKTNKSMLGQLNAEIGRLETGSQNPGLGQSEKTEMNDLAATLSDLRDTVTGKVSGVDLSQKFAQARGMVSDLGKSYYNQINDRIDFLKAGVMPAQQAVYDTKQNQLQKQYVKRFKDLGVDIAGQESSPQAQGGKSLVAGGGLMPAANAAEGGMSALQAAAQAELKRRAALKASQGQPQSQGGAP